MKGSTVFETLWGKGPVRCVLVQQRKPRIYRVQIIDHNRIVCADVVDSYTEALDVAVLLWTVFASDPL